MTQHFDNQNQIRLLQPKSQLVREGTQKAGSFVVMNGSRLVSPLGLGQGFKATILDARPMAISLEGEDLYVTYDGASEEFQTIVERAEKYRFSGMYGFQLAVGIDGHKYIMPFTSKSMRTDGRCLLHLIDKKVIIQSVEVTTSRVNWYTVDVWVNSRSVAEYKPQNNDWPML